MIRKLLLLTSDGEKTFNVELTAQGQYRGDPAVPRLVSYKGTLYMPRQGYREYPARWVPIEPLKLEDPKVAKPRPKEIDRAVLEDVALRAKHAGFTFKVRNRDGKQYADLAWSASSLNGRATTRFYYDVSMPDRVFMNRWLPEARQTSGGYSGLAGCTTWRLNP